MRRYALVSVVPPQALAKRALGLVRGALVYALRPTTLVLVGYVVLGLVLVVMWRVLIVLHKVGIVLDGSATFFAK